MYMYKLNTSILLQLCDYFTSVLCNEVQGGASRKKIQGRQNREGFCLDVVFLCPSMEGTFGPVVVRYSQVKKWPFWSCSQKNLPEFCSRCYDFGNLPLLPTPTRKSVTLSETTLTKSRKKMQTLKFDFPAISQKPTFWATQFCVL